jgi:hypothetical protein
MSSSPETNTVMKDFLKTLLIPLTLNKFLMMYFGLNMSEHPGEGYGYGFTFSVAFLLISVGRFVWKYRNVEDP